MSKNVRSSLSQDDSKNGIDDMLIYLIDHYTAKYQLDNNLRKITIYEVMASAISEEHKGQPWKWRYIMSVCHGTLKPGRFLVAAIEKKYNKIESARKRAAAQPKRTYPHVKIRTDNAASAARTMRKKIKPDTLSEIVRIILAEGLEMEY